MKIYIDGMRLKVKLWDEREFFATVQNKLHWAITSQTASEIVYTRASHTKIWD